MIQDVGAERAVLSGICQYGKEVLYDVVDIIDENTFTIENNKFIFVCVKEILQNQDKIDPASIILTSKQMGFDSIVAKTRQDLEVIRSLFNFPIDKSNVRIYAKKIAKLEVARKAQEKHKLAYDNLSKITGNESIDNILSVSESPIFDLVNEINKGRSDGPVLIQDDIDNILQDLIDNPVEMVGIPTPWKYYNAAIGGGLRRGGVNLIGARPKQGKSTTAKEACSHFALKIKIPTLYLDTEMAKNDVLYKLLASLSNIEIDSIETGKFGKDFNKKNRVFEAASLLKSGRFYYQNIAGKPFEEVLSIIRRWILKEVKYDNSGNVNNCVVVYDYFKLMDDSKLQEMQEYQALGFQISKLSDFTKEFDFPCLAFVQLNRDGAEKDSSEVISQSDRLLWLCHSFSIFRSKRPEEILEDGRENGNKRLKVLDVRFGPGMDSFDYINMRMTGELAKIEEIGLKSQPNNKNGVQPQGFEIINDNKEQEDIFEL